MCINCKIKIVDVSNKHCTLQQETSQDCILNGDHKHSPIIRFS